MGRNGVIGKGGKWYECLAGQHLETSERHNYDAPFVWCSGKRYAFAEVTPNRKQFETVMLWCTSSGILFEDIAIGTKWEVWLVA